MNNAVQLTVLSGTTVAYANVPNGFRLHDIVCPTLTSTDLAVALSDDGESDTFLGITGVADASKTWFTVYNGTTDMGAALVGAAFTGARAVVLPELLSRATEGRRVRLTVASQGADRAIYGHLVRAASA